MSERARDELRRPCRPCGAATATVRLRPPCAVRLLNLNPAYERPPRRSPDLSARDHAGASAGATHRGDIEWQRFFAEPS